MGDTSMDSVVDKKRIIGLADPVFSSFTLLMEGDDRWRVSLDIAPTEPLTPRRLLACVLPDAVYYDLLHVRYSLLSGAK